MATCIINLLARLQIDYAIGGALASSAWGEPRTTLDMDVAIDLDIEDVKQFSKELQKLEIYVPLEIILENLSENRVDLAINAIHGESGFKAEFFPLRTGDELRRSTLQRKKQVDFGAPIGKGYVHSPEDLIVYKLWYFSLSHQTKHTRDITGILLSMGERLDKEYIASWAKEKGVHESWKNLLMEIQDLE